MSGRKSYLEPPAWDSVCAFLVVGQQDAGVWCMVLSGKANLVGLVWSSKSIQQYDFSLWGNLQGVCNILRVLEILTVLCGSQHWLNQGFS